jgi:hypothetical protein
MALWLIKHRDSFTFYLYDIHSWTWNAAEGSEITKEPVAPIVVFQVAHSYVLVEIRFRC